MILVTPQSRNTKTGNIPQITIGRSREAARASCEKARCPRLTDGTCYAWTGTPLLSAISRWKSRDRKGHSPVAEEIERLDSRSVKARAVRMADIGDPAGIGAVLARTIVDAVRARGLALLSYTHGWRNAAQWRGEIMASTESMAEADEAIAAGWRACVVLPLGHDESSPRFLTPAGNRGIVCPAQTSRGKVDCNDCRLCDGSTAGPVIGFIQHHAAARKHRSK